jgi:hypothetical protein
LEKFHNPVITIDLYLGVIIQAGGEFMMTVYAEWDNADKTIMRWTFEGDWTWEEYYDARKTTNQEISAQKHPVDLIVDLRTSGTLPSGVLMHARNSVYIAPDNIGLTVYVGINPVMRAFYNMFRNLYRGLIHSKRLDMMMVATLDDAYAALAARDAEGAPQG